MVTRGSAVISQGGEEEEKEGRRRFRRYSLIKAVPQPEAERNDDPQDLEERKERIQEVGKS